MDTTEGEALRAIPAPPQPFLVFSRDLLPTIHGWPIISLRLMDNFELFESQRFVLLVIRKLLTRRDLRVGDGSKGCRYAPGALPVAVSAND